VLWDIGSQSIIKTISGIHESPILVLQFWKEGKNNLISSDNQA